jgi:hypothetical protein
MIYSSTLLFYWKRRKNFSERQNKEINYKLFEYCSKFLNIKKRDLL